MEKQEIPTVTVEGIEYSYLAIHKQVSTDGWVADAILRIVMSGKAWGLLETNDLHYLKQTDAVLQVREALRLLVKMVDGTHIDVLAEYLLHLNMLIKEVRKGIKKPNEKE